MGFPLYCESKTLALCLLPGIFEKAIVHLSTTLLSFHKEFGSPHDYKQKQVEVKPWIPKLTS